MLQNERLVGLHVRSTWSVWLSSTNPNQGLGEVVNRGLGGIKGPALLWVFDKSEISSRTNQEGTEREVAGRTVSFVDSCLLFSSLPRSTRDNHNLIACVFI